MITLGVPGHLPRGAAGGVLIWGLQPGPLLFVEKPISCGPDRQHVSRQYRRADRRAHLRPLFRGDSRIPFSSIAPVIIVICAIGAYTVHNSMFDVYLMVIFGASATPSRSSAIRSRRWCSRSCSATALKRNFRNAIKGSQGDLTVFFSNGLVGV